jgi:hypothetical protein
MGLLQKVVKNDAMFGVTESAKQMEDEEGAHDISPANVQVSQINGNTRP